LLLRQEAQTALEQLKSTVLEYVRQNREVTSADVTRALGLESDLLGNQKNYLAWSIPGILVGEGKIETDKRGASRYFYLPKQS
jgi:hypothetical protein